MAFKSLLVYLVARGLSLLAGGRGCSSLQRMALPAVPPSVMAHRL